MCLDKEHFDAVLNGKVVEAEITLKMAQRPLMQGNYFAFLSVFAIEKTGMQNEGFRMLLDALQSTVEKFTTDGVYFEEICTTAFSSEGKNFCDKLGMNMVGRHPRAGDADLADIYRLAGAEVPQSYFGKKADQVAESYREQFGER